MDRRMVGAVVAGLAGLAAVGALAMVLLTSNGTSAVAPQSPLLIARTDESEALYPSGLPDPPSHAMQNRVLTPTNPPMASAPPLSNYPPPVAPPFSGTMQGDQAPPAYGQAPPAYGQAPPAYGQAPASGQAPPPAYGQAPPAVGAGDSPPPVKHVPKPPRVVDHKYDGVFTVPEIGRFKAALKLSRDQEAYWPPLAGLLRELGRQQMAQIDAGQKPDNSMSSDMMQRFYTAASPLLSTLRDDQKAEVRRRAKSLGLEAYASYI